MRKLCIAISFVLAAACGSKSKPASTEPTEAACAATGENGTPATAEECECAGMMVVGDIGDGQVKCPEGTNEVSRIQYGIEGGVCCTQGASPPPAAP